MGIIWLRLVGNICTAVLVDSIRWVIGGPNDDNEDDFRSGRGYVDEIFILKRLGKNPERRSIKCIDLEKAYDTVAR